MANDYLQYRKYNIFHSILSEGGYEEKMETGNPCATGNRITVSAYQAPYHHGGSPFLAARESGSCDGGSALLFCGKTASVFIPIMIPQILAGHLYPRDIALLINLLGLVIVMSIPYWIGKGLGRAKMEHLLQKYPKIQSILKAQDENKMAFSFMLRACCVPPADMVTMYLGATGMPYLTNVIGGTLASFPSMVLTTFLGANIRNPESPAFWKALGLNVAWVILSGLGFYLFRKFHSGREAET